MSRQQAAKAGLLRVGAWGKSNMQPPRARCLPELGVLAAGERQCGPVMCAPPLMAVLPCCLRPWLPQKVDAELEKALATLESEKEAAFKGLDAQVAKLSADILSRVLPEGVKV